MVDRVEGVYPTIDEALQAVDRLKDQGYARTDIRLIANKDVRDSFTGNVDTGLTSEDRSMDRVDEATNAQVRDSRTSDDRSMDRAERTTGDTSDDDKSWWDSVKDAFTMDDSYDDPNYGTDDDPVAGYRDQINDGQILVVVNDSENMDITNGTNTADTQPNSIGPEGVRSPEDEMTAESREEELKKDHELRRHELDDYERKQ